MNFLELVQKRQSTRRFSERPVPREVIDRCLEAARLAPSACNSQPWSFIVVDEPELKNRLAETSCSGLYGNNKFVREAPVLIVIVTETSGYIARLGGMLRNVKYNLIDIGIAGEHLVLQAEEAGVGSCWLGWFDGKAVCKVLGLPKKTRIDVMIALGYPADEKEREKARKPFAEIVLYASNKKE